jgi:hypothetical protein
MQNFCKLVQNLEHFLAKRGEWFKPFYLFPAFFNLLISIL